MKESALNIKVSRGLEPTGEAGGRSPSVVDSGPKEGYMLALWTKLVSRFQEDKGASMVEYALLVVLIAIIAIVAVSLAGEQVSGAFQDIADTLQNP